MADNSLRTKLLLSKYILVTLISLIAFKISAQNNLRNEWLVGIGNIKFSFAPDTCLASYAIAGDSLPYKGHGHSSICDSNGSLYIGTNCVKVWNFKTGKIIEGAEQINNDTIAKYENGYFPPNVSIILPMPNELYYIFIATMSDAKFTNYKNSQGTDTFNYDEIRYSVVDMKQNSGDGKLILKNKLLVHVDAWPWINKTNLGAVQHANGRDWWVLKPCARNRALKYKFLLTPDSIFTSQENGEVDINTKKDYVGQGCFDKKGNQYAEVNFESQISIYDFDRCSGKLILKRLFNLSPYQNNSKGPTAPLWTSLCYSPNGNYLYISDFNWVYQLDINNPTDSQAVKCVSTYSKDSFNFAGYETMQLTPYNQILLGSWHGTSNCSNAIMNPDEYGMACNFKEDYLCTDLHPINPRWVGTTGMPNLPFYDNDVIAGSPCDTIRPQVYNWVLYPNPAQELIKLKVPNSNNGSIIEIAMYNMLGQFISKNNYTINYEHEISIPTLALATGVYVLKAKYGNSNYVGKFVKN